MWNDKVADKIMEESESRKTCVDKAKEFIKRINWLRTAKFMAPVATGIITGGAVAGPVGSFLGAVSGFGPKWNAESGGVE